MSTRERDFRPPRHRSFDDDRYETPTDDFGFEPRPSASTSSGPAVRAVVKWYKPEKGFGFVALSDGSGDAFLHASVLERYGARSVPPGAALEVRAGPGPKGPQVTEVLNVDASTALQEQPRFALPERPAFLQGDRTTVEELGTVKWYSAIKGFGFIAPDQGGKDIFVHASALQRSGLADLAEGQRVAVDMAEGRKGPEAGSLRVI